MHRCRSQLGDSIDPRSMAYKMETFTQTNAEKERQRRAALTPAQRAVEDKAKGELVAYIATLNVNTLALRQANPVAQLPLNNIEELMRRASVAGDFDAMGKLVPFSIHRWNDKTPLGKYRFNIVAGKKVYVPFSNDDIQRFVDTFGPGLIEPGAVCDLQKVIEKLQGEQTSAKTQFPASDPRHVGGIFPGAYLCKVYKASAWVRWRGAAAVAVAIVAAIYLGPIIAEKAAGMASGTAGSEGASAASTFSKIKDGANSVLNYVNKARSVNAIVNGELPPPPIGIAGDSFREWAFIVAKEQIEKEAINAAMEAGQQYVAKKMTEAEERKLRDEIAAMQRELEALTPKGVPPQPSPELAPQIKTIQLVEENKAAQNQKTLQTLLLFGIPAAFLLMG